MTGGFWVLRDGVGRACAAADTGAAAWPNHPFLRDNFAPVQEEITADTLTVIGRLPPEMDGMFVRNGPNPQFPPLGHYGWFTGDGMLHGVRVQGGQASYRNRYVRTARWQEEHTAGRALYDSFQAPPEQRNKANTALIWHAGRVLALYEEARRTALPCQRWTRLGYTPLVARSCTRSRRIRKSTQPPVNYSASGTV